MSHGGELFASREQEEMKRIWEWSQRTRDGTLSDLDPAPDPNVWLQVCSEAHVCTPRTCGQGTECFYQRARKEAEAAKVLVLNHSLFFNFLAGAEAVLEEKGYLFHNDFIISTKHTRWSRSRRGILDWRSRTPGCASSCSGFLIRARRRASSPRCTTAKG